MNSVSQIKTQTKEISCVTLIKHAHCVGQSNFHLQFTPAYRKKVFYLQEIRDACRKYFKEKANQLGLVLFSVEFGPDHAHLFVGNCMKCDVPFLAHELKGGSSYFLRKFYSDIIKPFLWGSKFWSAGYFYEGVGNVTSPSIKYYIERQQGKHWSEDELSILRRAKDPYQTTLV